MKWIIGAVAGLAALLSVGLASAETVHRAAIDHDLGAGIVLAYSNCMVEGGFDKSAAPSVSVAPSGRRVVDYDPTVQANIDAIDRCTLPFFANLTSACDCTEFADDIAIYTGERARLVTWLAVPIVQVDNESVLLGSPRAKFLMGN